ncbi:MAG: hypothetical protein Q7S22_05130 [Candidatus Micrarchaeota archaeon]|nr:hypothetical protein [Candidatus Micrarchaeota archaeon]
MTPPFSLREKEIFELLRKLQGIDSVVIGGYAVNAYTLPRFSVDCDIVIKGKEELGKIELIMKDLSYIKEDHEKLNLPYHSNFVRYEKKLQENFFVSLDILIGEVMDRRTGASFSADWIFSNSSKRQINGKTILEKIEIRVVDPDALVAMKCVSCRINDVRDIFMLIPHVKNVKNTREEIGQRTNLKETFARIKNQITSDKFRNSLQGVFGYLDEKVFEKHLNAVLKLGDVE